MNSLSQYLTPLLALAGTLIVAALGFYQWKKQSANQSRGAVAESRRKAAEALWSKLEEINLALREASALDRSRFTQLEREVNTIFLKSSLYLADRTQSLVSEYTRALFKVSALLTGTQGSSSIEWANTAIQISSTDSPEAGVALDEANRLRTEVKNALLRSTGA